MGYLRSDILPSVERQGLTSSQTVYRSVLVFRRDIAARMEPSVATDGPDGDRPLSELHPERSDRPGRASDVTSHFSFENQPVDQASSRLKLRANRADDGEVFCNAPFNSWRFAIHSAT